MLGLAQQFLAQIVGKHPDIKIDVSGLNLTIRDSMAHLSGGIRIEREIANGRVEAEFSFRNDPRSGFKEKKVLGIVDRLETDITTSVPTKEGGVAELITDQVQGTMFQGGLMSLLSEEFAERDVRVRGVGLHLLPGMLGIKITA